MKFSNIFRSHPLVVSCELFPPRTEKGARNLISSVSDLMEHSLDFITCTYGAGGSTRDKTLEIVSQVKSQFSVPVASHLTVVGSSVDDLRQYLRQAQSLGIDNIVALRGDPPEGSQEFVPNPHGLRYANELVQLIRDEFPDFGVAVAGYPETHREAANSDVDLDNLKRKVDTGADIVITQLFYDNDDFFRFRDRCQQRGISVPIVPGLLPVTSLKQVQKITALCGACLPQPFVEELAQSDETDWQFQVGVQHAIRQTESLLSAGVCGLHFYVLNRSDATNTILQAVNIANLRTVS